MQAVVDTLQAVRVELLGKDDFPSMMWTEFWDASGLVSLIEEHYLVIEK